ncbi:MAG: hypothetical protein J6P93_05785 [Alphaproteobacteria bacterium]|nr:hypothetical protein [Alphaproteobacteria bacterium]
MIYKISDLINPKDIIYIKGCSAIDKRDEDKLDAVLKDPLFDYVSYEALGLLFKAAENSYIKGFQMLGKAGVKMSRPLNVIITRHYIAPLNQSFQQLQPVMLTHDKTALHVLIEHINAEALGELDLKEYFSAQDIERTLNIYARGAGTPLQLAYNSHISANEFLEEHNMNEISAGFWKFYSEVSAFHPNVQAPTIGGDEMLFQKALRLNDLNTLYLLSPDAVDFLNACAYHYPKNEYDALCQCDLPAPLKNRMIKDFEEEPVIEKPKKIGFKKLFKFFDRQKVNE